MRSFNLFISHSWAYQDGYVRLITLLRRRKYFDFRDYSVPRNDPVHTNGTDVELLAAIRRKIAPCSVVLVMAGVYASYSKWITAELALAKHGFAASKPVVAIAPRGSKRISSIVRDTADAVVRWNTESIIEAIRNVAR